MLRKATRKDIPQLVEIERISFQHGRWDEQKFLQIWRYGTGLFLVSHEHGVIQGYIYVMSTGRILSLAALGNCGVGSKLLEAVHSCRKKLHLEVCASNTRAIKFYQKHGYVQYGIKPKYYENGEDALLMKRESNRNVQSSDLVRPIQNF